MRENRLFERLKARAGERTNWSPLLRWFVANHDEFAATIAEAGGRPGWDAIAAELTAEGITTRRGGPITGAYACATWWKARQIHVRRKAKEGRSGTTSPVASGAPSDTRSAPDAMPALSATPPALRKPGAQESAGQTDGPSPGPVFKFGIKPNREDT